MLELQGKENVSSETLLTHFFVIDYTSKIVKEVLNLSNKICLKDIF